MDLSTSREPAAAAVAPTIRLNGAEVPLSGITPHTTALDWLRDQGLTGAKEGCAEGECGACSVLVARPGSSTGGAPGTDGATWTAINACLVPAAALDGQELVTSEGLGTCDAPHPVQRELAVRGGSQCGFCTPGFVCSMAAEYYRADRTATGDRTAGTGSTTGAGSTATATTGNADHAPEHDSEHDSEHGPNGFDLHALSGNLCRCTGYRPIRDAAYALGSPDADDPFATRRGAPAPAPVATRVSTDGAEFVRPATLDAALTLLADRPDAQVVAGSTDWGVEVNLRGRRTPFVIAIDRLAELREFRYDEAAGVAHLGAALTLTELERLLDGRIPLLAQLFPQFASRLIRNSATLGGNLGTGSPIGDAPPVLLALDAELVLVSRTGERTVPLADYFTGYRSTLKAADELIAGVRIPLPLAPLTAFHKIAKRRFDDISSVAIGYCLDVSDGVVRRARIGLGGVAATPLRARATEEALIGRPWTDETVRRAAAVLTEEGTPMDDHRASASYRSAMLGQSLLRLHATGSTAENTR